MKKILIKILTMAILLTLLFSEAAFGENDDIYVRNRYLLKDMMKLFYMMKTMSC